MLNAESLNDLTLPVMISRLRWRGHDASRLEGFSDTVFAFALTRLVVALELPHNYEKLIYQAELARAANPAATA